MSGVRMRSETILRDLGSRGPGRATWSRWAARTVAVVGVVVSVSVLLTVLGLIGSGDAATAGALDVPVGQIVLVTGLGYLVGVGLVIGAWRTRRVVGTWVMAILAGVVTGVVSVYPIVATATVAVGQASEIVPWITDLIGRVLG